MVVKVHQKTEVLFCAYLSLLEDVLSEQNKTNQNSWSDNAFGLPFLYRTIFLSYIWTAMSCKSLPKMHGCSQSYQWKCLSPERRLSFICSLGVRSPFYLSSKDWLCSSNQLSREWTSWSVKGDKYLQRVKILVFRRVFITNKWAPCRGALSAQAIWRQLAHLPHDCRAVK